MASVSLEERMQKPAVCVTVFGEAHSGVLRGVDNNFNAVIDRQTDGELCFVRGETVLYIGFDDDNSNNNDSIGNVRNDKEAGRNGGAVE
ncbi:U6 snRNA-associated Sm-like protein LSm6p [Trypanosoma grayi]|uniref:U6 snRNA-associated Sm-like protein LSm6p n=1 Tax=Trypanosoma grayi TaxID=71804 RepID=UPI0004F4998C|nr:U6 snRNA-associated Sm-like protein LSm6p [Trypanosoma grayi]KEG08501.1 U6 snRNA-associated Sm-like protein LSm6p [Trypanosoma grayi]